MTPELSFEGCEGNDINGVSWSREVEGDIQWCYTIIVTPDLLMMSAKAKTVIQEQIDPTEFVFCFELTRRKGRLNMA